MAAERYLSWRIPDSRVGYDIGKIDKIPVPSIYLEATTGNYRANTSSVACSSGWGTKTPGTDEELKDSQVRHSLDSTRDSPGLEWSGRSQ